MCAAVRSIVIDSRNTHCKCCRILLCITLGLSSSIIRPTSQQKSLEEGLI